MAGLGSGIGHQGVFDKDYSGFEALEKDYYIKGAEKAKKAKEKDDFIKATDFKQDRSTTLPMYSKAMVEVQSGFYNRMAAAKQSDNPNAMTMMHEDFQNTRQELERLAYNNKLARGYMEQDSSKFWVETDITKMLMNPEGTLADLESINDGIYFQTAPDGGFNAKHVPKADRSEYIKWTSGDYNKSVMKPGATPTGIRGQRKITHVKSVGDEVYANRVEMMNQDPVIMSENAYLDFKQTGVHRDSLEDYKIENNRLNAEWMAAHRAPDGTEEKPYNERDPKEADTSGWGIAKLIENGIVTTNNKEFRNVDQTGQVPEWGSQRAGETVKTGKQEAQTFAIPFAQPLIDTEKISLSASKDMLSYKDNKPLTEVSSFSFESGRLIIRKADHDGPYKAFVQGRVTQAFDKNGNPVDLPTGTLSSGVADSQDVAKLQNENTYSLLVPLSYVSGSLGKNNVKWVQAELDKLNSLKQHKWKNSSSQ